MGLLSGYHQPHTKSHLWVWGSVIKERVREEWTPNVRTSISDIQLKFRRENRASKAGVSDMLDPAHRTLGSEPRMWGLSGIPQWGALAVGTLPVLQQGPVFRS